MIWGGPEFVLIIIGMAMFAGVVKTSIRARHGLPMHDRPSRRGGKNDHGEIEALRSENARLTERLESSDDRIAVLERIVTDSSYSLDREIEALRDDKGKVQ